MNSLIFLLTTLAIVALLFWLVKRSHSHETASLARKTDRRTTAGSSRKSRRTAPATGNDIHSQNEEIWQKRRKRAAHISASAGKGDKPAEIESKPNSLSRHVGGHRTPKQDKDEAHGGEPTMASIEYTPVSKPGQAPAKQ